MISVSVPAYNEEKTLHLCLDSLVKQSIKEPYEVIIVDNNSTDDTAKIIKSYAKKYNVRYVLEKQKGSGAARARGFDEAKGEYIFTTDADTIVPPNWIESMLPPLKKKEVAGVTSLSTLDDKSFINRKIFLLAEYIGIYGHKLLRGHFWLAGFSFGVRKDVYEKSGKINKELPMLDDVELSRRISKLGQIVLVKDVFVLGSSRRYQNGLLTGLFSYLRPFFVMTYLGKKADMKDYR